MLRIGQGFDVHRFGPGDHVVVGGIRLPFEYGLVAHSDGDVLLHAVADALLGALAEGDIGHHFPDTDPAWRGADSRDLLAHVVERVRARGFHVQNVDTTVIAQAPRMAEAIPAMRECIAATLGAELNAVSVKATTTERLGAVGRKEGLAAQAVVLLMHDG